MAKRKKTDMDTADPNWGGAREGAGRKPLPADVEKLSATIAFCVPERTKAQYKAIKARGVNVNAHLIESIDTLASLLGVEVD